MSFEGYEEHLCQQGHLWCVDVYDWEHDHKCPDCGGPAVWTNVVDQTNGIDEDTGEGLGTKFEVLEPATYEKCDKCGHSEQLTPTRYKIPAAS